jgi:hypothetical protein
MFKCDILTWRQEIEETMVNAKRTSPQRLKLEKKRAALKISDAALVRRAKHLREALARERAERFAVAFAGLLFGKFTAPSTVQFARAVQRLGLAAALYRLTSK